MNVLNSANNFLGIDIGTTSVKVVELKKENGQPKLVSYGFSENVDTESSKWHRNDDMIASVIEMICKKSKIKGNNAVSALPTFSVFSSVLNLSHVNKKEIASAVHWEAKKVIPLPLDEMILDWKEIKDSESGKKNVRVLLTGAPQSLVKKQIGIFKKAHMNLISLETETFSLIRSLVGNDKSTIMLVEIGASTTDVTIVNDSIPMLNRSIDVGGRTITEAIKNNLNVDFETAEQFKYDMGINSQKESKDEEILKVITDVISPIMNEIKYAMSIFQDKNNKKTEKIILSGGSAILPGLTAYLSRILNIKVIIGDPWSRVLTQDDLKPLLNEIGPRMSVAVGLAMREMY